MNELLAAEEFQLGVCRMCGLADDRPILRFAPVPASPELLDATVQTHSWDILLHTFCGKTATLLGNHRPELEILTAANLKHKHGIGPNVDVALARTRRAVDPNSKKNYYLVHEFEANLRHLSVQVHRQAVHNHNNKRELVAPIQTKRRQCHCGGSFVPTESGWKRHAQSQRHHKWMTGRDAPSTTTTTRTMLLEEVTATTTTSSTSSEEQDQPQTT